jgi:hypothetical protein
MSTIAIDNYGAKTLINQAFSPQSSSHGSVRVVANPSGITLNRRGRLARTFVVLSLAVVLASLFGFSAGAGTTDSIGAPTSFIEITVAPGDTLWSLATRVSDGGDVRALVDEIASVNSLAGASVEAGQKIRIPLHQ